MVGIDLDEGEHLGNKSEGMEDHQPPITSALAESSSSREI